MRTARYLVVIAAAWGMVSLASVSGHAEDALEKGAWALQFEVNGDFDLESFQGSTISLKRQTGDGTAYRIGLSVGLTQNSSDQDDDRTTAYYDPDRVLNDRNASSSDMNGQTLRLAIQRISYPRLDRAVKVFYGFGPVIGYSRNHRETSSANSNAMVYDGDPPDTTSYGTSYQNQTQTNKGWAAGFLGVLGVEWFFHPSISLLAEYSSTLEYTWSRAELVSSTADIYGAVSHRVSQIDNDGIEFGAGAVKFGLSAYF